MPKLKLDPNKREDRKTARVLTLFLFGYNEEQIRHRTGIPVSQIRVIKNRLLFGGLL